VTPAKSQGKGGGASSLVRKDWERGVSSGESVPSTEVRGAPVLRESKKVVHLLSRGSGKIVDIQWGRGRREVEIRRVENEGTKTLSWGQGSRAGLLIEGTTEGGSAFQGPRARQTLEATTTYGDGRGSEKAGKGALTNASRKRGGSIYTQEGSSRRTSLWGF